MRNFKFDWVCKKHVRNKADTKIPAKKKHLKDLYVDGKITLEWKYIFSMSILLFWIRV